jgi:hypothetical protein
MAPMLEGELSPTEIRTMPQDDWRHLIYREVRDARRDIRDIQERQKLTNRILWGMASTAGLIVGSRFLMFLLDSGALSISQGSP